MIKNLSIYGVSLLCSLSLLGCNSKPNHSDQHTSPQTNIVTTTNNVDREHTAENSLDWNGTYQGTLPCADCPGIKTVLNLNTDKTYRLEESYLERNVKPLIAQGTFKFDTHNPSIIVLDQASQNRKFFIGEGFAEARALDGTEINGVLKAHYKLTKIK